MPVNAPAPLAGLPVATPGAPAAPAAPAPAATTPIAPAPAPGTTPTDTAAVGSSSGEPSSASLPSSSSSTPAAKITGGGVSSIGDPHETTGDGLKFDNMKTGVFVKMRAKSGDFELQTRQDPWDRNPQATVNTAAAVKVNKGGDIVKVDAANDTITFNGKPITVKDGETFEIPGGGTIKKTPDGYQITSAAGDVVSTHDRGTYMDVTAEASPERVDGDIAGSLGRLDSDTDMRNDLVDRNGKEMGDVDAFIEEWRAKEGEDMFGGGAPVGGAVEQPPVDGEGEVKPAEQPENEKTLGEIRAAIDKLKADPANKDFVELLEKIEKLLGAAEGGEAAPQEELKAEVAKVEPGENAALEELLKLIMKWIELEQKRREAQKAEQDALDKAVKVAA